MVSRGFATATASATAGVVNGNDKIGGQLFTCVVFIFPRMRKARAVHAYSVGYCVQT